MVREEYDDLVLAVAARLFAAHDPWTAIAEAMELLYPLHFGSDDLSRPLTGRQLARVCRLTPRRRAGTCPGHY